MCVSNLTYSIALSGLIVRLYIRFCRVCHASGNCFSHHYARTRPATTLLPSSTTTLHLFNLKNIFKRNRPSPDEGIIEEDRQDLERRPDEWGKGLPTMEDLWKEAWPTDACNDYMKRKDDFSRGSGPPHIDHTWRNYGRDSDNTTYAIFYRDTAGWDPHSQSVAMMLEEKQMPYKVKKVNLLAYGEKQEWFLGSISPTGLMPVSHIRVLGSLPPPIFSDPIHPTHTHIQVLEVDGNMIRESVDICKYINWSPECGNGVKMYPEKTDAMHEIAEGLLILERDLFKEFFIYIFEGPENRGREDFLNVLDRVSTTTALYAGVHYLTSWSVHV